MTMFGQGCVKFQRGTNAIVCESVKFDYSDEGVNDTNARAMLTYYCICEDSKACE